MRLSKIVDLEIKQNLNMNKITVAEAQVINSPNNNKKTALSTFPNQKLDILPKNDAAVCTKYNYCSQTKMHPKQANNHTHSDGQSFQIPLQLLQDESPLSMDVLPTVQYLNNYETDKMIERNIVLKKTRVQSQKEAIEQAEKQLVKLKEQLRQKSKQLINKCEKIPLSQQKRPQWNHKIYGQKTKQQRAKIQQQMRRDRQQRQKRKQPRKKVDLNDCESGIKQYKQKQQQLAKQKQIKNECAHHSHKQSIEVQKDPSGKVDIEKNAIEITKKMRQDKLKQIQRQKTIQGKIKAIQISSRQLVQKSKKKPMDPKIQFKIDIQQDSQALKPIIQSNITGQIAQNESQRSYNRSKKQNSNPGNTKQPNNSPTNKKEFRDNKLSSQSSEGQKQKQGNPEGTSSAQVVNLNNKFYVWNIPIYKQDYEAINLLVNNTPNFSGNSSKQAKSFRTEVNQYLQQKVHARMQQQIKLAKMQKLQKQIADKKQQFLLQYEYYADEPEADEAFGNEDQVYKLNSQRNYQYI